MSVPATKQDDPVVVSEEAFEDAVSNDLGWCRVCEEFTRDGTEPDAEDYDCEDCGEGDSVVGAEQALLLGLIIFDGEV